MPMDYDVIVVGSGFGGSVSALRLGRKRIPRGGARKGPPVRHRGFPVHQLASEKKHLAAPNSAFYGIQMPHLPADT